MSFYSKPLIDAPTEDNKEFAKLDRQIVLLESKFLLASKEFSKLTDQLTSVIDSKFVMKAEYFSLFQFNKVRRHKQITETDCRYEARNAGNNI